MVEAIRASVWQGGIMCIDAPNNYFISYIEPSSRKIS